MSMGRRDEQRQERLRIATAPIAKAPGHPFCAALNRALAEAEFDRFLEERCAKFYAEGVGQRGIAPVVDCRFRRREKKTSDDDWTSPNDHDAKLAKMKDGRTHRAHTVEHAVDLDTDASLAVTVPPADGGDSRSLGGTLCEAMENLATIDLEPMCELVADEAHRSNDVVSGLHEMEIREYVSKADPSHLGGRALPVLQLHDAAHADEHTTVYDGIPEMLDAVVARGVPLAVLTNKTDERGCP